ncbi:hypothetical protein [Sphingomonas sp. Leaf37]|uniref:hypothetical protein n=1 Tax=Sphingomonas sp. Leaf37 TaxID=2876552 RepID=UPI001E5355FB|nr:hypothetical protein [Sphingomonas sp. Leaf37]
MNTALLCLASVAALAAGIPVALAQTAPTAPPSAVPATPNIFPGTVPMRSPIVPRTFLPLNGFPGSGTFAQSKYYQQTYELAQQYGRCATNVSPTRVRSLLQTSPNTRTELTELRQLVGVSKGCLPYAYRPPVVFLRGSLAEAMYKRQPVGRALHSAGTTQSDLDAFQASEWARSKARLPDDRAYTAIANCLVVRAPGAARSVLLSDHGSTAERQAVKTLVASAPGCSTSGAFPPTAGTSFVRAYLAESALRWAEFGQRQG